MPQFTIRVPGTPDEWPDERLAHLDGAVTAIDGQHYPITGGRRDEEGAVVTVDTGDGGPDLPAGTVTDLGPVQ